ncbi:YceD family protein [Chitinimonas sp.]|uniref:YceD family protein n=1 Tax=Chitinimonas sp. TaxID=1934313 RepID=UPI002F957E20
MSDLIFDNAEFARLKRTLRGELALAQLPRVASEVLSGEVIEYVLVGGTDKYQRYTLDLGLTGHLALRCQRCLKAVDFDLDVATHFTLFADEARLETADAEDDELEGLLFEQQFDLLSLLEDEILLSLPYAAVHEACEAQVAAEPADVPKKPNPFAVLADLKGKLQRGEH